MTTIVPFSLTPNIPGCTWPSQPAQPSVGAALNIFGGSLSWLNKNWSLADYALKNQIEIGLCPAPSGLDSIRSLKLDVLSRSVIWLRFAYFGTPPTTKIKLHLLFNFSNIQSPTNAEIYIGTQRAYPRQYPNGIIPIPPTGMLDFQLEEINAVACVDGSGQYLDVLLRICSTATQPGDAFNFGGVSGELIY